ncbi:hypothetical protein [Vandammella animalimorsus]|uniref:hypothetical protein n=1 Tax=Vandammella animalimorsus TaxID=2029117 RepID=UPI00118100AF|nr:hypothetical protein [Vandammella animalimorsus]
MTIWSDQLQADTKETHPPAWQSLLNQAQSPVSFQQRISYWKYDWLQNQSFGLREKSFARKPKLGTARRRIRKQPRQRPRLLRPARILRPSVAASALFLLAAVRMHSAAIGPNSPRSLSSLQHPHHKSTP